MVPSAAEVSIAMPYLPLPIPSRSSKSSDPVEGLVTPPSLFTSALRSVKICVAAGVEKTALVARADRPLPLFTKGSLAVDSHVSRYQGSRTRPVPMPWALSAAASLSIWASVAGGSSGLSPAVLNEFLL